MTHCLRLFGIVAIAILLPVNAKAQDSTQKDPWLSTFSVGFPSVGQDVALLLFTVGGNFTRMRPGTLGPDFSVGTMPILLTAGLMPIAARAGVALPMQYSAEGFILATAGVGAAMISPGMSDGTVTAVNFGIALATKQGTRVGITWHRFSETETIMLFEVGAGRFK